MKSVSMKTAVPVVAAALLAGCIAEDQSRRVEYKGLFRCDSSELPESASDDVVTSHTGPWKWEELAVRAGERSDASRVAYIDAAVRRLRAEEDLGWKNPEFRWGYDRSHGHQSDWQDNIDPLASKGSHRHSHDSSESYGVRLYVPNPFVERYARAKMEGDIRKEDMRAAVEAYEVYCEVKMLCYEVVRAKNELKHLEEQSKAWDDLRKACQASYESGVFASPLDAIRSETKFAKAKVKISSATSELDALRRRIAWLAGVSPEGLEIEDTLPTLPDPSSLSLDTLTEIAFARRPDLAAAIAELDQAEAGVMEARMSALPWFRFVEGAYQRSDSSDRDWEYGKRSRSHGPDDEWSVEVAITVPIFTWTGKSLELSKTVRERANARLDALYSSIRNEIETAYTDYVECSSRLKPGEAKEFVERMTKRIEEYSSSQAAKAEETSKAYEELIDYKLLDAEIRLLQIESALRLESVIGGPLPSAPLPVASSPVAPVAAVPEPVPEAAPESAPEVEAAPEVETEPAPESEPKPTAEAEPEAVTEPKVEPEVEPKAEEAPASEASLGLLNAL